ncbi:MAG: hypothetical protein BWY52_00668 [Chloroflexi bacterium ADurb.Bin325]|nr:MAG: hypothetical protein BWY52_00668 [Chloroflexi bacterium ADurb.Bin325]
MVVINKKPIQVYLEPEQLRALRALAKRRGVSMGELVRQGVNEILSEVPLEEDPLWNIVGTFDSGLGNLAEKHDEYIVEAVQDESR